MRRKPISLTEARHLIRLERYVRKARRHASGKRTLDGGELAAMAEDCLQHAHAKAAPNARFRRLYLGIAKWASDAKPSDALQNESCPDSPIVHNRE